MIDNNCIFCKIASGAVATPLLFEDDLIAAFADLHPQAPVHILVVPKEHIANLQELTGKHEAAMGRMLAVADKLAAEHGSPDGCRVIINNREIGQQEVSHLHLHILGGKAPLGRMLSPQH